MTQCSSLKSYLLCETRTMNVPACKRSYEIHNLNTQTTVVARYLIDGRLSFEI